MGNWHYDIAIGACWRLSIIKLLVGIHKKTWLLLPPMTSAYTSLAAIVYLVLHRLRTALKLSGVEFHSSWSGPITRAVDRSRIAICIRPGL